MFNRYFFVMIQRFGLSVFFVSIFKIHGTVLLFLSVLIDLIYLNELDFKGLLKQN